MLEVFDVVSCLISFMTKRPVPSNMIGCKKLFDFISYDLFQLIKGFF